MIATAMDDFSKTYGMKFDGVERFWETAVVLPELALRLAHEWGILDYLPMDCINWVLMQVDSMRETVQENQLDMFDLLAEYINEHLSETIVVYHEAGKAPQPAYERMPRTSIRIRVDAQRRRGSDNLIGGIMLFERSHFRRWFAEQGGNPREFLNQLAADGADATPRTKKASLAKHTPLSVPQCYVVGIDLSHPRMSSILEGIQTQQDDAVFEAILQRGLT